MWAAESFATLELLLGFLNERRIRASRCKVVVARDAEGAQRFHLLFQIEDDPLLEMAAVAQAETEPLVGADGDDAVDAAEAIIAEAQRDE